MARRRQWSARLPLDTVGQIEALAKLYSVSKTDIIIIAVNRFYQVAKSGDVTVSSAEVAEVMAGMWINGEGECAPQG